MALFSVVVPLFNKRAYIRRSVESILRQTIQDFEIVIVDDGSTDGSSDVVRNIPDTRVSLIVQKNQGVGAARNRGIAAATGQVIAFLDADDEWHSSFLEAVKELYEAYPQAGILATGYRRCFGPAYKFDREVSLTHPPANPRCLVSKYLRLAQFGSFVTSSSAAVPKTVIEQVGMFLEGEPFGEDREFWLRICLKYPLAYDSRILAVYHSEAEGRAYGKKPVTSQYPPSVGTLQAALDKGTLPEEAAQDARRYIDHLKIQYVYWHLGSADIAGARRLLSERYLTAGYRMEAALLRFGSVFLPARALMALKHKPLNLWSWLRQPTFGRRILGSGQVKLGRELSVRLVPQLHDQATQAW
jgi:glycosyltransferase involved in cell wall biosynthesis